MGELLFYITCGLMLQIPPHDKSAAGLEVRDGVHSNFELNLSVEK